MANDMRLGSKGDAVIRLQQRLAELGYSPGAVDGQYGPKTWAAIREYQEDKNLTVDGVAGLKTLTKLFPELVETYKPPVRHKVMPFDQLMKVKRATACVGAPIKYHLEYPNGGTDPESNMPCDEHTNQLDCSGFTSWAEGYDRWFKEGVSKTLDGWSGYSNTDSKIAEAEQEGLLYTVLTEPEAGCIIVGESFRRPLALKRTIGHEGVVVDVGGWKGHGLAGIQVVHCSPSNYKYSGGESAIWKTSGRLWSGYKKWKFLRFNNALVIEDLAE